MDLVSFQALPARVFWEVNGAQLITFLLNSLEESALILLGLDDLDFSHLGSCFVHQTVARECLYPVSHFLQPDLQAHSVVRQPERPFFPNSSAFLSPWTQNERCSSKWKMWWPLYPILSPCRCHTLWYNSKNYIMNLVFQAWNVHIHSNSDT